MILRLACAGLALAAVLLLGGCCCHSKSPCQASSGMPVVPGPYVGGAPVAPAPPVQSFSPPGPVYPGH
jgi:hypothetical protein